MLAFFVGFTCGLCAMLGYLWPMVRRERERTRLSMAGHLVTAEWLMEELERRTGYQRTEMQQLSGATQMPLEKFSVKTKQPPAS